MVFIRCGWEAALQLNWISSRSAAFICIVNQPVKNDLFCGNSAVFPCQCYLNLKKEAFFYFFSFTFSVVCHLLQLLSDKKWKFTCSATYRPSSSRWIPAAMAELILFTGSIRMRFLSRVLLPGERHSFLFSSQTARRADQPWAVYWETLRSY